MEGIKWVNILPTKIQLNVQTQVTPQKGNLVYEYNPFRNYRLTQRMYEYKELLFTEEELFEHYGIKVYRNEDKPEQHEKCWADARGEIVDITNPPILHEPGELVDFITDELSFDIKHPVNITPQYSYDGSVNLILNDGINPPRMINSRFSATGRNTYEVVDRKGNNDTNIYDLGDQFNIDTSLYKSVVNIPKIKFGGCTSGGNLKVGNYFFYFKLSDADGNETDFIGESGLVSVFIGFDDPHSVTTGLKNENSLKNVKFMISNIDIAYDYLYVYYSRTTGEGSENAETEYKRINKKFTVNNAGICNILITGFEKTDDVAATDINLAYNIIDSAKTATTCLNRLFLGNVHKPEIPYEELADLSLRFLPYVKEEEYPLEMDEEYDISSTAHGYYDEKYIYEKTGYWENELYRIGIVYIMPNGQLSPVFNIRGGIDICEFDKNPNLKKEEVKRFTYNEKTINHLDRQFLYYPVYDKEGARYKIKYNESTNFLYPNEDLSNAKGPTSTVLHENNKGVIRFHATTDTNTVHGLDIRVDDDTIKELLKYVRGYFFVRLKRIPTILCLGITVGIDKIAKTPTIPTAGGVLDNLANSLDKTHVTTSNINDVNHISEGFLSRYQFKFERKSSGLFGKIFGAIGIVVAVAALAVATVFTCGAAGVAAGATIAAAAAAGASAVAASAATIGIATAITVGAVTAGLATAGAIQEIRYALSAAFEPRKLDGRNTKIPSGFRLVETDESRLLISNFLDRIIIKDPTSAKILGILCPDYEVNLPYYNQIFTGNDHLILLTRSLSVNALAGRSSNFFTNDYKNHFYIPQYYDMNLYNSYTFKIIGVSDDLPLAGIGDMKFRARAGSAEEAWRYECIGTDYKMDYAKRNADEDNDTRSNKQINSDIIRGSFGAYLAFNDKNNKFSPAETVNIYIPKYSEANLLNYIDIRMHDDSTYSAISDRIDIHKMNEYLVDVESHIIGNPYVERGYHNEVFRGDCYICQFTHRMNRNFNAPSAPYNDLVVDATSWRANYDTEDSTKFELINLGDVNAVPLGMWVTFRIRSSNNLNIRTLDGSDVNETAMTGFPRGYYPYQSMSTSGMHKKPESQVFNRGFNNKLSERWNFNVPDIPYIKNWFGTRIMYSDIHINDAYINGYRVFRGSNFQDYTREYGEIVKLISLESNLLCVFEHGVVLIPVNERTVSGTGAGGHVYINTENVLPQNPIVISDMFGSQWADSVLKVPGKTGDATLWVYGVDTVAKKIWRTDGRSLTCISDFKVQQFLNENITLGERENTPILGIRNVKTCYNAFKRDVMFTFYDNTYGFEEKVWNLCWNELMNNGQGGFVTFYSWVPSFMENINNIPFSFDRNVSKWVAKLGTTHTESSFADGITLSNVLVNNYFVEDGNEKGDAQKGKVVDNFDFTLDILLQNGNIYHKVLNLQNPTEIILNPELTDPLNGFIGVLSLKNRVLPDTSLFYTIDYHLQRDPWNNYQNFEIKKIGEYEIPKRINDEDYTLTKYPKLKIPIYGLYFVLIYNADEKYIPIYTDKLAQDPVYWDTSLTNEYEVCQLATSPGPESMMTELYYRNKAKHAYADVDSNKTSYVILSNYLIPTNILDPDEIYPINKVLSYVWENWYHYDPTIIEEKESILKAGGQNAYALGADLLKSEGGPFEYDTTIYLKGYNGKMNPCSGGLGHMVQYPSWHAPFSDHFLYGSFIAEVVGNRKKIEDYPIFKDLTGRRPMLPRTAPEGEPQLINPDKIVSQLMIRADIYLDNHINQASLSDAYFNSKASYNSNSGMINTGYYESTIAITTKWNMQFMTSDFWKHGQAGLIDIVDDVYPTNWYGKQHPFEFECIVVNDPSVHKIFTNLEIISNKAKPESFHYEVIGDAYDFAKDKANMYFRLEAIKALWQYNGADIMYNRNFLKIQPRQNPKSADLIRTFYARLDTINEIEDYYVHILDGMTLSNYDYRHLSGGEILYYPNRQEFRVVNHVKAVDVDDLPDTSASIFGSRGLIASNMRYLEDRWRVTINPLLVAYRNEYSKGLSQSTWALNYDKNKLLPTLPIYNSPIPTLVKEKGSLTFPGLPKYDSEGKLLPDESDYEKHNGLYHLYDLSNFLNGDNYAPLDITNWLSTSKTYKTDFGENQNRKEVDIRDKFLKVRIRYSGEELAVIDWLNTIYQISYA